MRNSIRILYFSDYKMHPPIWEGNWGVSYSPTVAYLARWARGEGGSGGAGFFSYFPPLQPRCILWYEKHGTLKSRFLGGNIIQMVL